MANNLLVQRGITLIAGAAELSRTGLIVSRVLSFDEWTELGAGLQAVESGIQWVLGDWVNYGDARYGEKYAQAVEDTGYALQTLTNAAWVASRIPIFPADGRFELFPLGWLVLLMVVWTVVELVALRS